MFSAFPYRPKTGVLTAPSTFMEIVHDGVVIRDALPSIAPYSEERLLVDWEVPNNMTIGTAQMSFTVDPDETSLPTPTAPTTPHRCPFLSAEHPRPRWWSMKESTPLTTSRSTPRGVLISTVVMLTVGSKWNLGPASLTSSRRPIVSPLELVQQRRVERERRCRRRRVDVDEMMVDVVVLNRAPIFNLTHPDSVEVEAPISFKRLTLATLTPHRRRSTGNHIVARTRL